MRGRPFTIFLNEFIQTGQFGGVKPGMKMDEIKAIFPKPDSINPMGGGMSIWLYGKLEFHFMNDELIFIWCDWLEALKSPHKKQFKLDRGLLNGNLEIATIKGILKSWNISYKALGYYAESELEQIIYIIHFTLLYTLKLTNKANGH
ncbi:hypothetical protein [Bacteroides sp. 224]|uniref:hypothetical protein n=1 Tax=Bacteroides sp. 224 TaxID=2302936 RepID=UPI0013D1F266|nr:hypothetical protein [Bacteroides sp. 224]NDV66695.1 hypothetical protein [Bacteroides sp. 224]